MTQDGHCYAIELLQENGSRIGQIPIDIDWEPALEWAQLAGVRQGKLSPGTSIEEGIVQPVWHGELGPPHLDGFDAIVAGERNACVTSRIPTVYCRDLAQRASAQFVKSGRLKVGDLFRYRVLAFACDNKPAADGASRIPFAVERVTRPMPLLASPLRERVSASTHHGVVHTDDVPVFLPQAVLDETFALTEQADTEETGGVLIGHLHRDTETPEIFAEITAQIPARHVQSAVTKLTFTADTWAAVQAAVNLRRREEIYLGWWHSHPHLKALCKDCEKYREGTCKPNAAFMSAEDCALHRTVFPRAYSVALVIGDTPCSGLTWGIFGWRYGLVVERGCRVLNGSGSETPASATTAVPQGGSNAPRQ
jgi:hypothetical protein